MLLDLTSFTKAADRLTEAIHALRISPEDAFIRDAVIQRFEFTYEIAYKMLKRYLEMTAQNPQAIEAMSFQHIIRTGCEKELLRSEVARWQEYRKARSTTSHAYDEDKARAVAAIAPDFLEEARFLLEQLRKRDSEG
jgi:nucleotidyltransferase substrate binding protein (TIGR01987 family)